MLLNASFIAFETLNSASSSASLALRSTLALNGSLQQKTCNASSLKDDQNLAETIKMLYDTSFDVIWRVNSFNFQAAFQQIKRSSGPYLDSCLPDSHYSSYLSQLVFNVADCHITALRRLVHVVEVAEYIGQICKHHNKFFIVKLHMEVGFVISKKDFNLIFNFIQPREAFASRQPTEFGIKQKSHLLRSHFFGQKSEEPMIFFALGRMKLITLIATSITSTKGRGRVFDTRVLQCSEQWDDVTGSYSFFTSVTNSDSKPIIAGAPSVEMCFKFCQLSSLALKNMADCVLPNKNSSLIFLCFSYRAKTIKRVVSGEDDQAAKVPSADSSS